MEAFIYLFIAGLFGGVLLGLIGVGMALIAIPVLTFALPHLGVPRRRRRWWRWRPRWGS